MPQMYTCTKQCPLFFVSLWCKRQLSLQFSKPVMFTTGSHLEIKQHQCKLTTRNPSNRVTKTSDHSAGTGVTSLCASLGDWLC